jgi:mannosyltransferase OCH1-like enzyme
VYAIQKCEFYLKGLQSFQVLTDHKPLEGVFKKDLLDLSNPRLLRMREKIMEYSFEVKWVPGKKIDAEIIVQETDPTDRRRVSVLRCFQNRSAKESNQIYVAKATQNAQWHHYDI